MRIAHLLTGVLVLSSWVVGEGGGAAHGSGAVQGKWGGAVQRGRGGGVQGRRVAAGGVGGAVR